MKLLHGLMPGQVLQRDRENRAGAELRGTCNASGTVEIRFRGKKRAVRTWRDAGEAKGKRFACALAGLPAGGPYAVDLRIRKGNRTAEALTVEEVFAGDVWFLAGQSNMQGVGNLEDAPRPHPKVRAFYMRDAWGMAEEPLHFLNESADPIHCGPQRAFPAELAKQRREKAKGVCPGIAFGREMVRRTRVPQGLVLCAHGGTSMDQWSPDLREKGGESLYGAMLRRFGKLGQPAAGILWYQGESDSNNDREAAYPEKMERLIAETRSDFNQPDLPWFVVQIGRVFSPDSNWPGWTAVREHQRRLAETVPGVALVPAVDLPMDDNIHIGATGQNRLGARLARAADRLAMKNRREKPPIRLAGVRILKRPEGTGAYPFNAVEVRFANVSRRLQAPGEAAGFFFRDGAGNLYCPFYKIRLKGNRAILETSRGPDELAAGELYYACGLNPVANITDARDMGLPAFGPIPLAGCERAEAE